MNHYASDLETKIRDLETKVASMQSDLRDLKDASVRFTYSIDDYHLNIDQTRPSPTRLATDRRVSEVHHLINNLADILGLKRNPNGSNIVADVWVPKDMNPKEPQEMILMPTGGLQLKKRK